MGLDDASVCNTRVCSGVDVDMLSILHVAQKVHGTKCWKITVQEDISQYSESSSWGEN